MRLLLHRVGIYPSTSDFSVRFDADDDGVGMGKRGRY